MLHHSPFMNLEQSTHPLVDKLSILAAQQTIRYFFFCTAVMKLHPPPAVSSLPFVIVAFKDNNLGRNGLFLITGTKLKKLVGLVLTRSARTL